MNRRKFFRLGIYNLAAGLIIKNNLLAHNTTQNTNLTEVNEEVLIIVDVQNDFLLFILLFL